MKIMKKSKEMTGSAWLVFSVLCLSIIPTGSIEMMVLWGIFVTANMAGVTYYLNKIDKEEKNEHSTNRD